MDLKPLFVFPRWSNSVTLAVLLFLAVFPAYAGALLVYALDPVTLNVGYAPKQPVPYSHALHVGQLGLDCRYCHNTVEKADFAAIPPTETCMNCHTSIRPNSEKLAPVRESARTGKPIEWRMVTTVPDYVYFNHSAHVNAGVSCVECHGQINRMEVVYQAQPMNMAWCLQCHRNPDSHIRPKDQVTNLDWKPATTGGQSVDDAKLALGKQLKQQYHVNPNTDCITCHR
jgi:menaquinone reductase, multiheme cytochrome c subunit